MGFNTQIFSNIRVNFHKSGSIFEPLTEFSESDIGWDSKLKLDFNFSKSIEAHKDFIFDKYLRNSIVVIRNRFSYLRKD